MSDLVSVVLPTCNRAHLLGRSIQSVLAQTHEHLELIVVDDGSTDGTADLLASFSDPRLRILAIPANRGVSAARNQGIRAARGDFIAFQDDDDEWLNQKLEKQLRSLNGADPVAGLSLCAYVCLTKTGAQYVSGRRAFEAMTFNRGIKGDFSLSAAPCWLLRRACLDRAGLFDESLRTLEDWELQLRLSRICRFVHVEEPLYIQDWCGGNGLMSSDLQHAASLAHIERLHGARWASNTIVSSYHNYIMGRSLCSAGQIRAGRPHLFRAVATDLLNAKAWAMLFLSFLGEGAVRRARDKWRPALARS